MTPSFEPPRIASGRADVPSSLCDAVKSASTDGPTRNELAALSAAVAPLLAAPPAPTAASGAPSPGAFGGKIVGTGAGKGATWLAVFAVCAAGGYGAYRMTRRTVVHVEENFAPAAATAAPAVVEAPPPAEAPLERPNPSELVTTLQPPRPRELPKVRAAEPPPAPAREETAAEPDTKQLSEGALIELARKSVTQDPRKALALVQDHHRRFSGGPLAEEADYLEIEAMKRLGRFEEARALDDRFRKRYPTSMHGQTVQVKPAEMP